MSLPDLDFNAKLLKIAFNTRGPSDLGSFYYVKIQQWLGELPKFPQFPKRSLC